jgi:hypothetical protein
MIVTKAMAEKYLIKRGCYLIKNSADGGYALHATSINWKEGMELFESYEECRAEIDRRVTERMNSGNCARCHYKPTTESARDLSQLESLGKVKFGMMFRCQSCNTIWYKKDGVESAQAYWPPLLDYLQDWSRKKISLTPEWKGVLNDIKNISDQHDFELYPAHVVLKNGEDIPCALISLERRPPPAGWFHQSGWYYLDQIREIKPSRYAYSSTIARYMIRAMNEKPFEWIYIKDATDAKIYGFAVQAGVFMPEEFIGKEFQLMDSKKLGDEANVITVFEPEERRSGVIWNFIPPPKSIRIWGDLDGQEF